MKRQPREKRRTGVEVVPTGRDIEVLRVLARLRIAPTRALLRLCFAGIRRDTALRRIRRLFDGGLLSVAAQGVTSESLYTVGPQGRRLLRSLGDDETPSAPRGGLEHHLAIVETWVGVVTLGIPEVSLQLARADWELREELGGGALAVIPDLFVVFERPTGPVAVAIEVDLGTEPLKVLHAKLAVYTRLLNCGHGLFGWQEVALAVALKNEGRLAAMREMLSESWLSQSVIWSLKDGCRAALSSFLVAATAPLADSPCCKGRGVAASPLNATLEPEDGRRP